MRSPPLRRHVTQQFCAIVVISVCSPFGRHPADTKPVLPVLLEEGSVLPGWMHPSNPCTWLSATHASRLTVHHVPSPLPQVTANPGLATGIGRPQYLNQIAWILNNNVMGLTLAGNVELAFTSIRTSLPYTVSTKTYTGCSKITWQDVQAVIWAMVQPAGTCDNFNNSAGFQLCDGEGQLGGINKCNMAYLWNTAFEAVAPGASYTVPSTTCGTQHPIVPVVLIPDGEASQQAQVQLLGVDIGTWNANCHASSSRRLQSASCRVTTCTPTCG